MHRHGTSHYNNINMTWAAVKSEEKKNELLTGIPHPSPRMSIYHE